MSKQVLICNDIGFLMLRKCCTTSLKVAVLEALGYEPRGEIHSDKRLKYTSITGALKSNLKLVAIIRNPKTRVLSAWRNKLHERAEQYGAKGMLKLFPLKCSLEAFLKILPGVIDQDDHIKPQVKQIPKQVEYYLDFERINEHWELLRKEYNYLPALNVHNKTALEKEKLLGLCSLSSEQIINKIYKHDLDLYSALKTRHKNDISLCSI